MWYSYSKSELKPVEELCFNIRQTISWAEGKRVETGKDELVDEMKKQPWGAAIKEVNTINLSSGQLYVLDGNLMLDSN